MATEQYTTFADMPREDLNQIPFMESNGWTRLLSRQDTRWGRTTPENPPHDSVSFKRANVTAWCCRLGWQTARLIDNRYQEHQPFNTLLEVVQYYADK